MGPNDDCKEGYFLFLVAVFNSVCKHSLLLYDTENVDVAEKELNSAKDGSACEVL